jgi:hypothetical protein
MTRPLLHRFSNEQSLPRHVLEVFLQLAGMDGVKATALVKSFLVILDKMKPT